MPIKKKKEELDFEMELQQEIASQAEEPGTSLEEITASIRNAGITGNDELDDAIRRIKVSVGKDIEVLNNIPFGNAVAESVKIV